jgi:hypothetical protein
MRITLVILALVLAACGESQSGPVTRDGESDPGRNKVEAAFGLYQGCIKAGFIHTRLPVPSPEIESFVEGLDSRCVEWMVVWYMAFLNEPVDSMTELELDQFTNLRALTLFSINQELREIAQ